MNFKYKIWTIKTQLAYLIGFLLVLISNSAQSQFTALTNEVRSNTTTAGEQWVYFWSVRTIVVAPDGSTIQAWIDNNGADGQGKGIYMQRFDTSGAKIGSETLVNTTTAGDQTNVCLAVSPDGSFIIGWDGPGTATDAYAQRFTKDGVKDGTEFILNTTLTGTQQEPEIVYYSDGGFVAVWVDGSVSKMQRFDKFGRTIGLETTVDAGGSVIGSITALPRNRVFVTYDAGGDVYGRIFDASLQGVGVAKRLNTYTTNTQQYAIGRADALGNLVTVWQSTSQDGSGEGIYGQRWDSSFVASGSEFAITTNVTNNQIEPKLAVEAGGRFIIVWHDNNARDTTGSAGSDNGASVWFREYRKDGTAVGSETLVNQSKTGYQGYPVIDINNSGIFSIAWEGSGWQTGQNDAYGVYFRKYKLSQTGTTTISVTPASTIASDTVTVTMTITGLNGATNIIPNNLSISGTYGAFADLYSGPTPSSATGAASNVFTWKYIVTGDIYPGNLTFGGNVRADNAIISPYAISGTIRVQPSLYLCDITAPNLIDDSNNPSTAGPKVFTIGAKLTNASLNPLTDVNIYLGDGTTPGTFPATTMTTAFTNNTYQGTFRLTPVSLADCTRPLITLGAAKAVIAGKIDFNGDGVITTADDGTLSNGKKVIDGLVDYNGDNVINSSDNYTRPPGLFTGFREANIRNNGFVDTNNDGVINSSDSLTYGGETRNIYWQVTYATVDSLGQPTFGSCNDFVDDLRYDWVIWGDGKDGYTTTTRNKFAYDYAKVRCELSAASNKILPSGAYITGSPSLVIDGKVDVNNSGAISTADDGTFFGYTVIDGSLDMNGSGTITAADVGFVNTYRVRANGLIDYNGDSTINTSDDGMIVLTGQTFSITVNNATFGTIGNGFDENRDGLWDLDFWHQPIGNTSFPAGAFRLIDIQSDITGTGGNNPLRNITTHYDNEPYLSRLFNDLNGESGGFNGTYTYTFTVRDFSSGFTSLYQEAASGTNNEKYCGDYGVGVFIQAPSSGTSGLLLNKRVAPSNPRICDTIYWRMPYQNISSFSIGDPGSGNGVVIEDSIPNFLSYVAGSAASSSNYYATPYYSINNGLTWTSNEPSPASSINRIKFHVESTLAVNDTGSVSFKTMLKNCSSLPNNTVIQNISSIKIGTGASLDTGAVSITVSQSAPVISSCGTNQTGLANSNCQDTIPNFTSAVVATDDCTPTNSLIITQSPTAGTMVGIGTTTITLTVTDECGNSSTCTRTFTVSTLTISGTVYNDANGQLNSSIDGTGKGSLSNTALYMNLVSGGLVVGKVPLNSNGTYSLTCSNGVQQSSSYSLVLSTTNGTIGQAVTAALPTGWVNTAEGTTGTGDGTVNGAASVTMALADVTGVLFGVDKLPTATSNTAASQLNPGGTQQATMVSTLFSGTDTGDTLSAGRIDSIRVFYPTNATSISINGVNYTPAGFASAFPVGYASIATNASGNPTPTITVDPLFNGSGNVVFTYFTVDNAGKVSASSATATMPFTSLTISGTVFDDGSGLVNNGTINGTGLGNPDGVQLYVNIIDSATNIVRNSVAVSGANGTFTITDSINANTAYKVQLSSTQGVIGSAAVARTLPTQWSYVGEQYGTNNSSGTGIEVGTPDGNINLRTVVTSSTTINFGIDKGPTSFNKTYSGLDSTTFNVDSRDAAFPYRAFLTFASGTDDSTVSSIDNAIKPGKLSANDFEDGRYSGLNGITRRRTLVLTTLPNFANDVMVYNNGRIYVKLIPSPQVTDSSYVYWDTTNARYEIPNFNDTSLSIFIQKNGHTSLSFQYGFRDSAGVLGTISTYSIASPTPLPITLLSFNALLKENYVALNWQTASELNTDHFEVERSYDGIAYEFILSKKAAGRSSSILNYSGIDGKTDLNKSKLLYYKLLSYDIDGSYSESKVQVIKLNNTKIGATVKAWPIPFVYELNIDIVTSINETVDLCLEDINGHEIYCETLEIKKGNNLFKRNQFADLANGAYILSVKGNSGDNHIKIIKASN